MNCNRILNIWYVNSIKKIVRQSNIRTTDLTSAKHPIVFDAGIVAVDCNTATDVTILDRDVLTGGDCVVPYSKPRSVYRDAGNDLNGV